MSHANVLGHLKTGDLLVFALWDWDITVIHAEDLALLLRNTSLAKSIVTPSSLVAAESDSSSLCTVVDTGEFGKSSPSAADVQKSLAFLEIDLLADNGKLVILELLKRLLLVDIRDNTRGVDHAWAKEPSVEVITTVVVVSDLLLICESNIRKVA